MDRAIEFVLKTIVEQLNFSNDPQSVLVQNLETYLPDIYHYSLLIMDIVVKPIAYSVLGFLLLLEFHQIAQKIYSNYSAFGRFELFLPLFLKLGLSLLVMRNLTVFIHAIVGISTIINVGIGELGIQAEMDQVIDFSLIMEQEQAMNFFEKLTLLLLLFIPLVLSLLTNIMTKIVVFLRFFELYFYFSLSPIILVTFIHEEINQIGKNFFRMICASSLQGVLLFMVLSFYPLLVQTLFSIQERQGLITVICIISGNCLTLCISLFYTNKWAKAIMAVA